MSDNAKKTRTTLLLSQGMRQALVECGVDLDQLRKAVSGLADIDREGFWASESGLHALATVLAQTPEGNAFGIRWARMLPSGSNGIVERLWRTADSVREALEVRSRYSQLVLDSVRLDASVEGDLLVMRMIPPSGRLHPLIENYRLTRGLFWFRMVLDDPTFELTELRLTQPRPTSVDPYRETFGPRTHLRFDDRHTAAVFPVRLLDEPLPGRDPLLKAVLEEYAGQAMERMPRSDTFVGRVEHVIASTLHEGPLTLDEVAKRLHVGERTLRRRLASEGTSYSDLLDRVRSSLAELYRRDPRLKAESLAERLGFESASAYRRASKRWRRSSPPPPDA